MPQCRGAARPRRGAIFVLGQPAVSSSGTDLGSAEPAESLPAPRRLIDREMNGREWVVREYEVDLGLTSAS